MISSLYKLYYRSNGNRTPLEDFNTECLVGVFNYFPQIGDLFAVQFLELPKAHYTFTTQEYYPLSDDPNCFVDMVLKSESCVCFVENKVDSTEGYEQINRYQKVLSSFSDKVQKEMRYITKNSDVKTKQLPNFKQYRWYEVATFLLLNFNENPLIQDYLKFLKQRHMAQETKFTTDTVIAIKNFNVAYETARLHLNRGYHIMIKYFPNAKFDNQNLTKYKLIVEGGRLAVGTYHIFKTKEAHTEILIGLHLNEVKFQVQLWMHLNHPQASLVLDRARKMNIFDVVEKNDAGYMINFNSKLYEFIETEDDKIEVWFNDSLSHIKKLIVNNSDIPWNPRVV